MNNKKKLLNGMGAVALLVLATLVPLKTCAVEPVRNKLEIPTEITKEVENIDFSKYKQVKEPLENAKEGMFKVNLVTKDGKVTRIDSEFQNGIKVLKGRTAVSMYDMSQTVSGIDLSWDQGSRIATAKNEGNELKYPIDRRVMTRNGAITELDVAATVDSKVNRTYLPLRSLMESLGYGVEYHEPTKTIDILEKGAPKIDHSGEVVEKPKDEPVKPAPEKPVEKPEFKVPSGIPSGAELVKEIPEEKFHKFKYNKNLPDGGKIEAISVDNIAGIGPNSTITGIDKNGKSFIMSYTRSYGLSFLFHSPDIDQKSKDAIVNVMNTFFNAYGY